MNSSMVDDAPAACHQAVTALVKATHWIQVLIAYMDAKAANLWAKVAAFSAELKKKLDETSKHAATLRARMSAALQACNDQLRKLEAWTLVARSMTQLSADKFTERRGMLRAHKRRCEAGLIGERTYQDLEASVAAEGDRSHTLELVGRQLTHERSRLERKARSLKRELEATFVENSKMQALRKQIHTVEKEGRRWLNFLAGHA